MNDTTIVTPHEFAKFATQLILAGEPFMIAGAPGSGKTEITKLAAANAGFDVIVEYAPYKEPSDILGLPHAGVVDGEMQASFLPIGNMRKILKSTAPTLVFFDEIGKASKATQNAIAQVMLSREVEGVPVPQYVTFCAATNRRQDCAGEQGMPSHFVDRFTTILELRQSIHDWTLWAGRTGPDGRSIVPPELISYCRFKPSETIEAPFDPSKTKDMVKVPTARTMVAVGRLLKAGISDYQVLAGAAGASFAVGFSAWLKMWKQLPDPQAVLANPEAAPVPEQGDIRFALAFALSTHVSINTFEAMLKYLERMPTEYLMTAFKAATARNPALMSCPACTRFLAAHSDWLL